MRAITLLFRIVRIARNAIHIQECRRAGNQCRTDGGEGGKSGWRNAIVLIWKGSRW